MVHKAPNDAQLSSFVRSFESRHQRPLAKNRKMNEHPIVILLHPFCVFPPFDVILFPVNAGVRDGLTFLPTNVVPTPHSKTSNHSRTRITLARRSACLREAAPAKAGYSAQAWARTRLLFQLLRNPNPICQFLQRAIRLHLSEVSVSRSLVIRRREGDGCTDSTRPVSQGLHGFDKRLGR